MNFNLNDTAPCGTDHRYVVIMAGGKGERFWPVSRQATPKQLITLLGTRSLLQQAVDRVLPIVQASHIFVITNVVQAPAVRQQLPELPSENIIAEPCGRDTCAAVTLGGAIAASRDLDAVIAVLSADHLIPTVETFRQTLLDAFTLAGQLDVLITLGIRPTEPATGYGYIQLGEPVAENKSFHKALRFVEKPNLETAQKYLASGDYRWNAGMFVWSCDSLFKALSIHQPVMAKAFQRWKNAAAESWKKLDATLEAEYPGITKISIDFALMEKAQNILAADANFLWDDLGSWPALTRHLQHDSNGNCSNTHCVTVDAKNNLIFDTRKTTPRSLISLLGIHDSVIVFTDDAALIAAKSESQRIKEIVAKISADPEFKNLI